MKTCSFSLSTYSLSLSMSCATSLARHGIALHIKHTMQQHCASTKTTRMAKTPKIAHGVELAVWAWTTWKCPTSLPLLRPTKWARAANLPELTESCWRPKVELCTFNSMSRISVVAAPCVEAAVEGPSVSAEPCVGTEGVAPSVATSMAEPCGTAMPCI